jgi:hypothetical protein
MGASSSLCFPDDLTRPRGADEPELTYAFRVAVDIPDAAVVERTHDTLAIAVPTDELSRVRFVGVHCTGLSSLRVARRDGPDDPQPTVLRGRKDRIFCAIHVFDVASFGAGDFVFALNRCGHDAPVYVKTFVDALDVRVDSVLTSTASSAAFRSPANTSKDRARILALP